MKLGETGNAEALTWGRPLDGIRVLALEQLQSLPVSTQLMSRFGAEIVKVEPPGAGESGRLSLPGVTDLSGRKVGPTFLRNNLGKRSIAIDFTSARGCELIRALAPHFDVVCENLGPGRVEKLGLDYATLSANHPKLIYLSISGFGGGGNSPYEKWPAYAGVAESMCGIYDRARQPHQPPIINPLGGIGDNSPGLYGAIGLLLALRHRDRIGRGQYIDVAMLDSMVAMCDIVPLHWSLGTRKEPDTELPSAALTGGFRARDGWFMVQVLRRHQFERFAKIMGHPEWIEDARFATPWGWNEHKDAVFKPAIEEWASHRTKFEAARALAEAGVAAAPCSTAEDIVNDPHIAARRMLVEIPRTDGVEQPVLVAGNPIKMSRVAEGPESNVPTVGEHTDEILEKVLGLDKSTLAELHSAGVVG